jgi:hypothetical protein
MNTEQLEKWIKENEFNQIAGEKPFVVRSEDLRALFDGKVLVPVDAAAQVEKALKRAFNLGQIYWQQADSESYSQNRKSDETQQRFTALVGEISSMLTASQEHEESLQGKALVPVELLRVALDACVSAGYDGATEELEVIIDGETEQ